MYFIHTSIIVRVHETAGSDCVLGAMLQAVCCGMHATGYGPYRPQQIRGVRSASLGRRIAGALFGLIGIYMHNLRAIGGNKS